MSDDFRQNGIGGITGQTGVGKSHYNDKLAQQNILDNPYTGKQGTKALILDAKEEPLYSKYQVLRPEDIKKQPQKTVMRMVLKHPNGVKFSAEEKKKLFYYILNNFGKGMIIFEDFNTYALQTKTQEIIGPLTTARHDGADIFFSMQNMSKVTKEMWENISWYRFHRQTTSVDSQKDDIEDFELLKIAEIIVNEQYKNATILRNLPSGHPKKLSELEFKKLASFHVWVDFRTRSIAGCKYDTFKKSVLKMIMGNRNSIRLYASENGLDHKKRDQFNEAVRRMIISYLPMYKPTTGMPGK